MPKKKYSEEIAVKIMTRAEAGKKGGNATVKKVCNRISMQVKGTGLNEKC